MPLYLKISLSTDSEERVADARLKTAKPWHIQSKVISLIPYLTNVRFKLSNVSLLTFLKILILQFLVPPMDDNYLSK